jgi:hypothetical protein
VFLCLFNYHAIKTYGGVEVHLRVFSTSALDGGEWSASRPGRFTLKERAPRVDPRAGLDRYWSIIIIMALHPLSELKSRILNKIRRFGYWFRLLPQEKTQKEKP